MEEKEKNKYLLEIQKQRSRMRTIQRTRKERTRELIKVGALVDMLGLLEKDQSYLTGLLLQHFVIDDEKREKIRKIGEKFFEERSLKKDKGDKK
ncbi:conjugal transfer protein TraD [uncultured Sneathia sp.]|jgi:hypothetical protein|uniref:conjugal transfer protein TraD n=1 Tax=uncultured Sneathia sp. TaxID=278067 RepID=UPI00259BB9C2|nr:conjugal transfer protein TraD [uncultured Sneathia sp.]